MHVPQESPHTPVLTQPGSPCNALHKIPLHVKTLSSAHLSESLAGMLLGQRACSLQGSLLTSTLSLHHCVYLPLLAQWYLPPRSQFQRLLFSGLLSCTSQEEVQVMVTLWLTLAVPQTPSKIHCLLLGRVFQMQLNFKSGKQISCHQEVGLASLLKALTEPKYCLCQHSSGLSCVLLASQSQGLVPLHLPRSLSSLSGFRREP